jgi:predicted GH43/DUF377 family glycosyl hydrolase
MHELFNRSEANPIVTVDDIPYLSNAVFNAGACDLGDEVLLLLRVETSSGRSHLIPARSKNGVDGWQLDDRALIHPKQGCAYEALGAEDCRITWMEDLDAWALAYVAYSTHGPGVALATTKDFKAVDRIGMVLPPDDKNAALFPRKFDGLYALLHRPLAGGGNIWVSFSPDLVYWGRPSVVLPSRGGPWWDGMRVGAGLQPIETEHGWLIVYHGVKEVAGGPIYRLGAALLDIDDPTRVTGRSHRWLLSPSTPYERTGDGPNIVFSCGGLVRDDELWVYYGAADSSICLATAKLSDVLDSVESNDG